MKPLQDPPQAADDERERGEGSAAPQLSRVMHDRLRAEHVFALGINLEGQVAAMDFEQRQVIHRFLDHDTPFRSSLLVGSGLQPATASENGFDPWHIPGSAGSVPQRLEGLLPLAPHWKQEIAAVLEWVDRILVAEAAGGLFFGIEGQAEAGINPTLADPGQALSSRPPSLVNSIPAPFARQATYS